MRGARNAGGGSMGHGRTFGPRGHGAGDHDLGGSPPFSPYSLEAAQRMSRAALGRVMDDPGDASRLCYAYSRELERQLKTGLIPNVEFLAFGARMAAGGGSRGDPVPESGRSAVGDAAVGRGARGGEVT